VFPVSDSSPFTGDVCQQHFGPDFARMSNSHLRRSPSDISMYALTVPSSFTGGVSRQMCLEWPVAASRLADSCVVPDPGSTLSGG
jgi:hypothetical protein